MTEQTTPVRCAVSFPGPLAQAVRCALLFRHDGQHVDWETDSTWPNPAAAVSPPAVDQTDLRQRIAQAARTVPLRLGPNAMAMAQRGEPIILNMSEADDLADAVLTVLLGPIPAGTDTATWTAIRAIQLMNEASQERDEHRLALSEALGLGAGAPWDAIRDRAAELAAPADRTDLRQRIADALRADACNGDCDDTEEDCIRRRMQPCVWEHGVLTEVLGTPEVIAAVVLAELRRLASEAQPPECGASLSGDCLREAESETACDTEGGECVHGGKPAVGAQQDGAAS